MKIDDNVFVFFILFSGSESHFTCYLYSLVMSPNCRMDHYQTVTEKELGELMRLFF